MTKRRLTREFDPAYKHIQHIILIQELHVLLGQMAEGLLRAGKVSPSHLRVLHVETFPSVRKEMLRTTMSKNL